MNWNKILALDTWLDRNCSDVYKQQPLAQDWARVAKAGEEVGEAIEKLISYTGQNPRKEPKPEAYYEMLDELSDVALTALLAITHFTKDTRTTEAILNDRLTYLYERIFGE